MVIFRTFVIFSLQKFAKVAVILFLAHVITKDIKNMGKMRTMIKVMAMILPIVGLVGASNLSTADHHSGNPESSW